MLRRTALLGASFAAVAACACVPGDARGAVRQVLARTPTSITSLAAGGDRVAWSRLCSLRVGVGTRLEVRSDGTGAVSRIGGCRPGFGPGGCCGSYTPQTGGVTSDGLVWWFGGVDGNSESDWSVHAKFRRTAESKVDAVTLLCGANGCSCGNVGSALGPIAAGGAILYSTSRYIGDPSDCASGGGQILAGGAIHRIERTSSGARSSKVGSAPGASMLAAAAGRFAERPLVPGGPIEPGVEVRTADTGALISSFIPSGSIQALGLARRFAAVLVNSGGSETIQRFAVGSGDPLGSTAVPTNTAPFLDVSGHRILYLVGRRRIHLLNLRTGRDRLLIRAGNYPDGLSLDGNLVVWYGQTPDGHGVLLGITLR